MDDVTYKDYVKKSLWEDFVKQCHKNSLDFYSCGCILTAHLVMKDLMCHTYTDVWKEDKVTVKEAWYSGMDQTPYHSCMSASITATIIAKYSPRGEEFAEWCQKDDVVMVDWKGKKRR